MQRPEFVIQKHWMKKAKYKKKVITLFYLYDVLEETMTKSKSMFVWLRIGMETFWCDGNVLELVFDVGYMCVYNCQNSSIWTVEGHAFHCMLIILQFNIC